MDVNTSGSDVPTVEPPTDYETLIEDVRTLLGDGPPNSQGDDT